MYKKTTKYFTASVFLISLLMVIHSCTKEDPDPANPYDSINYNTDTTGTQTPDPFSITGLHKNIFSTRCNVPGCHDGTFEPDFRTIQSSYSTLVYQRVTKVTVNNVDSFIYRVIPFDTTNSFLHERITTVTTDYMPSNGNRLSQTEIQQINTWILNGAKDINGNIPVAPNNLPNITGYIAFDDALYQHRIDTVRYQQVSYNPFVVQQGDTIRIVFFVQDDSTAAQDLQLNQLKWSLDKDDFSGAQTVQAVYAGIFPVWVATVNVTWPAGTQVYFRYYVRDNDNLATVEFPRNEQPIFYKWFYSFIVQ